MATEATVEGRSMKPSEPFTYRDDSVSPSTTPQNHPLDACIMMRICQPAIVSEMTPLDAGYSVAGDLSNAVSSALGCRSRNLSLHGHTTFLGCGGGRFFIQGEWSDCILQLVPPHACGLACCGCTSIAAASRFEGMFGLRMRWRDSIRSPTAAHRGGPVVTGWHPAGWPAPPGPGSSGKIFSRACAACQAAEARAAGLALEESQSTS